MPQHVGRVLRVHRVVCVVVTPMVYLEAVRWRLSWPTALRPRSCPTPPHRSPAQSKAWPSPGPSSQKPRPNLHPKRGRSGRRSSPPPHWTRLQRLGVRTMVRAFLRLHYRIELQVPLLLTVLPQNDFYLLKIYLSFSPYAIGWFYVKQTLLVSLNPSGLNWILFFMSDICTHVLCSDWLTAVLCHIQKAIWTRTRL